MLTSCYVQYKRMAWSLTPDIATSRIAALRAAFTHRRVGSRLFNNDGNTNISDFLLVISTQTFHEHQPKQTVSDRANKYGD